MHIELVREEPKPQPPPPVKEVVVRMSRTEANNLRAALEASGASGISVTAQRLEQELRMVLAEAP